MLSDFQLLLKLLECLPNMIVNFPRVDDQVSERASEEEIALPFKIWSLKYTIFSALSIRSKCLGLFPLKGRRIRLHLLKGVVSKNLWAYFETTPLTYFSAIIPC